MPAKHDFVLARRTLLLGTATLAAMSLVACDTKEQAVQQPSDANPGGNATLGRRMLGSLEVSSLGLGCQNVSRTYQDTVPNRPDVIKVIRTAYERGVTFFDTAEAYGPHEAERIVGESIAPFRDKVVVTSKFGWNIDLETGERLPGLNSRPDHIKLAVEGMLKRIGADARFVAGDFRSSVPRFAPENLPHNMALVELVQRWAERKNAAPAQIALAWLMAQRPWIVPIPGTTQMPHLLENLGAVAIQFAPSELAELNAAASSIEIQGARLPEAVLALSELEAPPRSDAG